MTGRRSLFPELIDPMPKTILLVDDQELIIRVVQATLRPLGLQLPSAKSGQEAVRYLENNPPPDGMVLDVSMPGQDGVETLRQIRDLPSGSSIPVIMLTARDQTLIRKEAEGLQVFDFITKPFSPNSLQQTVKRMVGLT